MKYFLIFLILILIKTDFAQNFPNFLQGTWQIENKESFEHWDKLNENSLKGFSYKIKNGEIIISEYLNIEKKENDIVYTAFVLNQNEGKGINFKLIQNDSAFIFENPDHDFPKIISYQKFAGNKILVSISDGKQKISYKMKKLNDKISEKDTAAANPNYDAELAQQLGADDYGMKSFVLVLLKTGNNKTTDEAFINSSFRGHLNNIGRLVKLGKLIVAGPLSKNENNYRGIFIFNSDTIDEVEKLLQTDPAVKAGLLDFELYDWYGSAALPKYIEISEKIWKVKP